QVRLVESGRGLRAAGDSVLLSCHGSGYSFDKYGVWWWRQTPGGRFELISICWASAKPYYTAVVEGRATASRDNSQSKASLLFHTLHLQDSGRYFCAVHTETGNAAEV
ncbi:HV333 protein, partial [Chionis minor]|nr:HV333 protein [Chionis minor]